jgi:hypothetical protein
MKYVLPKALFLCAAIAVLMYTVPLRAEEASVGMISEVNGTVTVTRSDGRKIDAGKDLDLYPGDMLTTGKDGFVGFVLTNGDVFRLSEDAQVSLDELSVSEEDTPPVLRLALGFLWSKIKPLLAKETRQVIHTPTAVLGVRGTEFDTVVAEDSSSAVAVDHGAVEIEAEKATVLVNQGQSTEVDPEETIKTPEKSVPKDRRDWKKFRKEKAEKLIEQLPENAPRIRIRFERNVNRYLNFTQRINAAADDIDSHIAKLYDAKKKGDRKGVRQQLLKIKSREKRFRPMALKFRKAVNRVRVIGRNAFHVKTVFTKHRHRFSPADRAVIEPNLSAISEKLPELRQTSKQTITHIKQTYRKLKGLRRSADRHRQGAKQ